MSGLWWNNAMDDTKDIAKKCIRIGRKSYKKRYCTYNCMYFFGNHLACSNFIIPHVSVRTIRTVPGIYVLLQHGERGWILPCSKSRGRNKQWNHRIPNLLKKLQSCDFCRLYQLNFETLRCAENKYVYRTVISEDYVGLVLEIYGASREKTCFTQLLPYIGCNDFSKITVY